MPVENGRRFKFKSAVWGPTLVGGLRDHGEAARGAFCSFSKKSDSLSILKFQKCEIWIYINFVSSFVSSFHFFDISSESRV